jgi:excisionase family DNA binding protein
VAERLLTAREVADWLGLAPSTVLDRFERGELPGFRLGAKGGPVRFDEGELREWLDSRRVASKKLDELTLQG